MQNAKIDTSFLISLHEIMFKQDKFYVAQLNLPALNEICFFNYLNKPVHLTDVHTVAIFKVKPKKAEKSLVVNTNMELVEEIIYKSKYEAA